jgi:capsular exopolysaccharide synthesis family protein
MAEFVKLIPKPDDDTDPFSSAAKTGDELTDVVALEVAPLEEVAIQKGCRLVVHSDPRGPAAERFRYLRIRLRDPWEAGKLKTILVTSALPRDGKSTVALNLASSLCEHGKKRVLLIEGDLHRPSISLQLGLEPGPGLVECLETDVNPLPCIRRLEPLGWYLLKAGGDCINPTELMQSGALPGLLARLSPHFDWILLDSPPVIPVTDALAMAREVDAILMVVKAGSTPREAVQRSLAQLGRRKLLAVVLNAIEGLNRKYSRYGYYDEPSQNRDPKTAISDSGSTTVTDSVRSPVAQNAPVTVPHDVADPVIDDVSIAGADDASDAVTDYLPDTSNSNGQGTSASTPPDSARERYKRRRKVFGGLQSQRVNLPVEPDHS